MGLRSAFNSKDYFGIKEPEVLGKTLNLFVDGIMLFLIFFLFALGSLLVLVRFLRCINFKILGNNGRAFSIFAYTEITLVCLLYNFPFKILNYCYYLTSFLG